MNTTHKTLLLGKAFCLFTFLLPFFTFSQQHSEINNRMYVRIIVPDALTTDQQHEIDEHIRSKEGVLVSRMDIYTKCYLGIYDGDLISSMNFDSWIAELGYTAKCKVEGPHGTNQPMTPLTLESCTSALDQ